jgi:hypothetical protein
MVKFVSFSRISIGFHYWEDNPFQLKHRMLGIPEITIAYPRTLPLSQSDMCAGPSTHTADIHVSHAMKQ